MKISLIHSSNIYGCNSNFNVPKIEHRNSNIACNKCDTKLPVYYNHLSFCGKGACYAMDSSGNLVRFNSAIEASEKLGIDLYAISSCMRGARVSTKDYAFCNADELDGINPDSQEYQSKSGELLDKAQSAKKYIRCVAIDKDGNMKEYESFKDARCALGLDKAGLGNQLSHCNGAKLGNYTFYQAYLFDGVEPNSKEFKKIIKDFEPKVHTPNKNIPCIAVDIDGNVAHFNSYKEAADTLKLGASNIGQRVNNGFNVVGKYAFCRADEMDGLEPSSPEYKKKIEELRMKIKPAQGMTPCVAVNIKGEALHFNSVKEAEENLGISQARIYKCIRGQMPSAEGYAFCSTDEIDEIDTDSKEYIARIDELKQKVENDAKKKGCIAVDKKGNVTYYSSFRVACRELNLGLEGVGNSLAGRNPVIDGYAFCSVKEMENMEPDSKEYNDKIATLTKMAKNLAI